MRIGSVRSEVVREDKPQDDKGREEGRERKFGTKIETVQSEKWHNQSTRIKIQEAIGRLLENTHKCKLRRVAERNRKRDRKNVSVPERTETDKLLSVKVEHGATVY